MLYLWLLLLPVYTPTEQNMISSVSTVNIFETFLFHEVKMVGGGGGWGQGGVRTTTEKGAKRNLTWEE